MAVRLATRKAGKYTDRSLEYDIYISANLWIFITARLQQKAHEMRFLYGPGSCGYDMLLDRLFDAYRSVDEAQEDFGLIRA